MGQAGEGRHGGGPGRLPSHRGNPGDGKAAVHQLARSLAAEWGSRPNQPLIRVNSISPGYIRTRMTEDTLAEPGMEKLWEEGNMLSRLSYADEYRGPIVFLLSDASSFV
ncbi:MAG: SDR family oxidoreductase, partial [Verrucomicrobiaceae bacterium]